MKVCSVFSLESPHQSDSNEDTQYTILNKTIHLIILNLHLRDFFQETIERVRNSRGKRAINVPTVLLFTL